MGKKGRESGREKKQRVPGVRWGGYLAKVATILEGDMAKTEVTEEITRSQPQMNKERND